jgi:uncharacterized protein (DUF1684 family)
VLLNRLFFADFSTTTDTEIFMTNSNQNQLQLWRSWVEGRQAAVTSPQGNLALIQTTWLRNGESFNAADVLANYPKTVALTDLEKKNFKGEVEARGYRLWDSASPSIQNFSHIETYDYNPDLVFEGRYKKYEGNKPVAFEFIRDNGGTRDLAVPGVATVTIGGAEYNLHAFDDGGPLLLVFADPTNGKETYESGRFLFLERIEGSEKVIIDFNRAFVPPCGFSISYNCPLPPRENRIAIEIKAGERLPIFKNNHSIYTNL